MEIVIRIVDQDHFSWGYYRLEKMGKTLFWNLIHYDKKNDEDIDVLVVTRDRFDAHCDRFKMPGILPWSPISLLYQEGDLNGQKTI